MPHEQEQQDETVRLRFDLPPAEAMAYYRSKGMQTSFGWQDVWKEQHAKVFTVAKCMKLDVLTDIRNAVDDALENGQTFEQFRRELEPTLRKKGWWGKKEMLDPVTGEVKKVWLGTPWRLKTIFRTNIAVAQAVGRWQEQWETREERPWLLYDAVMDKKTRDEHRAWDGVILPITHKWWDTHYPPNGWSCRCTTIALSNDNLQQMGLEESLIAPPTARVSTVDKRTGKIIKTHIGIDKGWDYNPGKAGYEAVKKQEKEKGYPKSLKAAAVVTALQVRTRADMVGVIKDRLDGFSYHGIKDVTFTSGSYLMATDSRGSIAISQKKFAGTSPASALLGAFRNMGRKPLTFNQEYALEALWHEIMHNRQTWTYRLHSGSMETRLMETVNQWLSRRTYQDMMSALGNFTPIHQESIKVFGVGYQSYVQNFDALLKRLGVHEDDILEEMLEMHQKTERLEYIQPLAAILAKHSGKGEVEISMLLQNMLPDGA